MKLITSPEWRALVVAGDLLKRDDKALQETLPPLKKRDGETVTKTVTAQINQTFTERITTTILRTVIITKHPAPETMHHTETITTTLNPTLARVAPALRPDGSDATIETTDSMASSPTPTSVGVAAEAHADEKHQLSGTEILGIVLGSLAFIGLLVAGLLFSRRMYRKYRQQRVWRKQITSEGNPMPNMRVQPDGTMQRDDGFNPQRTAGGALNQFLTANYATPYGTTHSRASRTGGEASWQPPATANPSAAEREKQAEAARDAQVQDDDCPPMYTIDLNEK